VGGLRREAGAFARREADSSYLPRPAGALGEGRALTAEQRQRLRALGYVEE